MRFAVKKRNSYLRRKEKRLLEVECLKKVVPPVSSKDLTGMGDAGSRFGMTTLILTYFERFLGSLIIRLIDIEKSPNQ